MYVTWEASQPDKSIKDNCEQPENIEPIFVTPEVSKSLKLISIIFEHPENI